MPQKPLQVSDRCGPVSPTVPALQLELHHPAPRSLLCMDASFCVLRCRVLRRAKKSRRLHNGAGCAPAAAPLDPPVPSREAIFGRRAVEASGWDGRRPGGYRRRPPYPSVSSFSLHLLLGGAVCAVPGTARAYSCGARYACLLRAQVWLWTGGLRGMLTAVFDAKNREKCCPNCVERCARSV